MLSIWAKQKRRMRCGGDIPFPSQVKYFFLTTTTTSEIEIIKKKGKKKMINKVRQVRSLTFIFFLARVQICGVADQWDSSEVPAPSTHGWHPRRPRTPRKHNAQNRVMDLPGAPWRCGS